jgi:molecular chaperone HtpG
MTSISRTRVNLGGLMKVLGENLYSTPNVALRELVQNAHDSIHRRKLEDSAAFEPAIEVRGGDRALVIEDNGAGLTRDEIDEYLATVGSGYTRDLRDRGATDSLIGYFGLGFLSAFIVSEKTEVHTASYQTPDRAWLFQTRKGESYTVSEAPAQPVGTTVRLQLAEGFTELGDIGVLQALLERYCCLLEHPIRCAGRVINASPPPWRDPAIGSPIRRRRAAIEFAERFEARFAPLLCIELPRPGDVDPPCSGMLWVQDAGTYGTSDNRNVWVFVRRMMVTHEDRELLPDWAGFCGAVIESTDLVPTASRESLKRDVVYDRTADYVRDALIRGLADAAREQPEAWRQTQLRHNEALRGAALCDERLFELLAEGVTVPTTQGELTVPAVLDRAAGKLYVSQSDRGGYEELLFRALKVPVVQGVRYAALPFCREYADRRRGQLVVLGTDSGDSDVFGPPACDAADAGRLREWFAADDTEVVPSSFDPPHLPLVLVPDRDVELKRRIESDEADSRMSRAALGLARGFTARIDDRAGARLYVNTRCPAIAALLPASDERRQVALRLLQSLVAMLAEGAESRLMGVDRALENFCDTVVSLLVPRLASDDS